jgi:hypothetical protein
MKYVVFGAPLHVEAASESEAVRIGEQHGLPSPIAMPLTEPIQAAQGIREYWVFDRAKDAATPHLVIRAVSKKDAERVAKEQGVESPHATLPQKRLTLK